MRLRKRQDYRRMFYKTLKFVGTWICVDLRITHAQISRLGITVKRQYGCACRRNRFKRLVREAFRLNCSHLSPSFDIVVRPRSQALKANRQQIENELVSFIQQAFSQKSSPSLP